MMIIPACRRDLALCSLAAGLNSADRKWIRLTNYANVCMPIAYITVTYSLVLYVNEPLCYCIAYIRYTKKAVELLMALVYA